MLLNHGIGPRRAVIAFILFLGVVGQPRLLSPRCWADRKL